MSSRINEGICSPIRQPLRSTARPLATGLIGRPLSAPLGRTQHAPKNPLRPAPLCGHTQLERNTRDSATKDCRSNPATGPYSPRMDRALSTPKTETTCSARSPAVVKSWRVALTGFFFNIVSSMCRPALFPCGKHPHSIFSWDCTLGLMKKGLKWIIVSGEILHD